MNTFKNLSGILTLLLISVATTGAPKYIIGLSANYVDFKANYLPDGRVYNIAPSKDTIWPGDTVGIQAGVRSIYLRIKNLRGSVALPIIITNYGGRVEISNLSSGGGMSLKACRNIVLSGSGNPEFEYGILIDTTMKGNSSLGLDELTSDVEVHNLEICRSGFAGIVAKTDPNCNPATHRENFVMQNLHFHHNYIHHTQGEGFYIGFSNYGPIIKNCSGVIDTVYAHEVHNLRVHDNVIDHTGLDGIQVGCATENIMVYNNKITRTGANDDAYSRGLGMEGIIVGGGSTGWYFNNYIADTYGSGIFVFGIGDVHLFNNTIVRPGLASHYALNQLYAYGIYCADRTTIPGASFYFVNNTIISPRTSGIKIVSTQSRKNRVYNNVVVDPLMKHFFGSYSTNWMKSCIQIDAGCDVIQQANYFDTVYYDSYHNISGTVDPYFEDALNGNYRLNELASMVDIGIAADTVSGFDFDADSLFRPSGEGWDVGAFEYQAGPHAEITLESVYELGADLASSTNGSIAPNGNLLQGENMEWNAFAKNGHIYITPAGSAGERLEWMLFQVNGQRAGLGSLVSSGSEMLLPHGVLKDGVYLLTIDNEGIIYKKKLLLVN